MIREKRIKWIYLWLLGCFLSLPIQAKSVIDGLLQRVVPGSADKFVIHCRPAGQDYFELSQEGDKVAITGNNNICIAVGLDWYLKYYAGIQLCWNNMQANLPAILPPVQEKVHHSTNLSKRYYLNYCTYSYSMAFWDWDRWQKEIDWMALHGINLTLSITGVDAVWYAVLKELGYSKEDINRYIAGPGFQAWWLMNNLEGWGGPNPDSWYRRQLNLAHQILQRMREYGIEPVLPGYLGVMPYSAKDKLHLNVTDTGRWCGYNRPGFLSPTDPSFPKIAALYYKKSNQLLGKANYYSMDPFHEGGNTKGVDFNLVGQNIMKAMKLNNPKAVWVAQAWGENPRPAMTNNMKAGDLLVLDLYSESRPQWGDPISENPKLNGFYQHDWIFCQLLNFGGNVGMFGKMKHLVEEFYKAKNSPFGKTMRGVGLTMEGIENNPVMYELLCELPWRADKFDTSEWLSGYVKARYGKSCEALDQAWQLLARSSYGSTVENPQQGTTESIFCAQPAENIYNVSVWANSHRYYDIDDVAKAARLMLSVADQYKGNNNFEYDLVDVMRQALADKGRMIQLALSAAYRAKDKVGVDITSAKFLQLLDLQDELLSTRPEFMVGTWIKAARDMGTTPEEKDLYEWNARTQITVWGNRVASEEGGLRDYAHREWNGILKDFYRMRWTTYFDYLKKKLDNQDVAPIRFYDIEEPWTRQHQEYPYTPQAEVIPTARKVFEEAGF